MPGLYRGVSNRDPYSARCLSRDLTRSAACCSGALDHYQVTHVDRPGEQQDHAREHVGEVLLGCDADQDCGERAANQKLRDRDAEYCWAIGIVARLPSRTMA